MAVIRPDRTPLTYDIAAWILAGVSLVLILSLHVLPALLAGLLVYELVHILAPRLKVVRIHQEYGKLVAVAMLATVVVMGIVLAIIGIMAFLHSEAGNLPRLLKQMADILDRWRAVLPESLSAYLLRTSTTSRTLWWKVYVGTLAPYRRSVPRQDASARTSSSGWGLVHS
jgi:predicted PurR-regulated permease PerM